MCLNFDALVAQAHFDHAEKGARKIVRRHSRSDDHTGEEKEVLLQNRNLDRAVVRRCLEDLLKLIDDHQTGRFEEPQNGRSWWGRSTTFRKMVTILLVAFAASFIVLWIDESFRTPAAPLAFTAYLCLMVVVAVNLAFAILLLFGNLRNPWKNQFPSTKEQILKDGDFVNSAFQYDGEVLRFAMQGLERERNAIEVRTGPLVRTVLPSGLLAIFGLVWAMANAQPQNTGYIVHLTVFSSFMCQALASFAFLTNSTERYVSLLRYEIERRERVENANTAVGR